MPYWRAGGDRLDVDCMVLVYDSTNVSARYKESRKDTKFEYKVVVR